MTTETHCEAPAVDDGTMTIDGQVYMRDAKGAPDRLENRLCPDFIGVFRTRNFIWHNWTGVGRGRPASTI